MAESRIPVALRPVAEEIVAITDAVCSAVLDEEYARLARRAVVKLARKRPSPLLSGRRATWGAGVVYALGRANFLTDPTIEPFLTADQLSEAFGVAKSTMSNKARLVEDLLRISPFSPEFQRADIAEHNPLIWIVELDGLAVDARHLPFEYQADAFQRGLIPYIPALGRDGTQAADLLARCSELKRELVAFARSPRFSRQLDQAVREGGPADLVDHINLTDHFILGRPLSDGRTVVEVFAAEHPGLTSADREMLLGWRDVVGGVFEIREQDGVAFTAVNLGDELTYRIYSNAGPDALDELPSEGFVIARIVPFGEVGWLLSGAMHSLTAFQDRAAFEVAARMRAAAGAQPHAEGRAGRGTCGPVLPDLKALLALLDDPDYQ